MNQVDLSCKSERPQDLRKNYNAFRYALAADRIDGCGTRKDSRLPTPIPAPAGYAKRLNGTRLEHSHWRQVAMASECIPKASLNGNHQSPQRLS